MTADELRLKAKYARKHHTTVRVEPDHADALADLVAAARSLKTYSYDGLRFDDPLADALAALEADR